MAPGLLTAFLALFLAASCSQAAPGPEEVSEMERALVSRRFLEGSITKSPAKDDAKKGRVEAEDGGDERMPLWLYIIITFVVACVVTCLYKYCRNHCKCEENDDEEKQKNAVAAKVEEITADAAGQDSKPPANMQYEVSAPPPAADKAENEYKDHAEGKGDETSSTGERAVASEVDIVDSLPTSAIIAAPSKLSKPSSALACEDVILTHDMNGDGILAGQQDANFKNQEGVMDVDPSRTILL